MAELKIPEIKQMLAQADEKSFSAIERSLAADTRKGVVFALDAARKRIEREREEQERLQGMYTFEQGLLDRLGSGVSVGLDEVGRGPLAGPLTIGAVVLDLSSHIEGLNDSKQLSESRRQELSVIIKREALAWAIVHIEPEEIDSFGMTACLRLAFSKAIAEIDGLMPDVDAVLLDGNPLHLDAREQNVIKGDAKCPSIAAASIIAKVERDDLMKELALSYPQYGFEIHKGYGTQMHRDAIKQYGLCEIHRRSFCSEFTQQTLF